MKKEVQKKSQPSAEKVIEQIRGLAPKERKKLDLWLAYELFEEIGKQHELFGYAINNGKVSLLQGTTGKKIERPLKKPVQLVRAIADRLKMITENVHGPDGFVSREYKYRKVIGPQEPDVSKLMLGLSREGQTGGQIATQLNKRGFKQKNGKA